MEKITLMETTTSEDREITNNTKDHTETEVIIIRVVIKDAKTKAVTRTTVNNKVTIKARTTKDISSRCPTIKLKATHLLQTVRMSTSSKRE